MAQIKQEQEIQLFADEDKVDTQSVLIDMDDPLEPWMIVSHCGEEFSLSVRNWDNLVKMVNKVKSKINEQKK